MKVNIKKRLSRQITDPKDIEYLVNLTEEDCCKLSLIMECFGEFNGKRRFHPYDLVTIPAGVYGPEGKKNKNAFITTVGLFIFNKAFIEQELIDLLGYVNKPVTKKVFGKINTKLSQACIEDKITLETMKKFILKTQKFMPYCNILSNSISEAMLSTSTLIEGKKQELLKKYEKGLKENDPGAAQQMENELLAYAKDILKDDPAMDMINSGSKISWGNNFKNMMVMRGAYKKGDITKGDFGIITGNYMDGVKQEEYADFCDSLTGGPYARAKKTEVGGYLEKAYVKAFGHLVILDEGTDCGTKRTKQVHLTEDNIDLWMYNYIVEGNQLIELTSDNKDKYLGKTVNFRFAIFCESKKGICSKCAGHFFHRIGIKNIGIATYNMMSRIKNISMKAFHDGTIKLTTMSKYGYDKIFGL